MKKRRIRRPAASFVLKKGAFARLNDDLVRVRGINAKQEVLVQYQATCVMQWVKPGDLTPPVAPEGSQVLHPVDAAPDAEARARQWVQEFALLPLRPSTSQLEEVALRLGASERTVRRHLRSYRMNPAPAAQLATPPGLASGGTRLPSVLEACIDKAINEELLRRECPPVTVVHERAKSLRRELGLSTVPSYQTVLRRTRRLDPWMVARKRRGSAEGDARQAPALGTVDAPRPLSLVQIDHAIVDVVVVSPISRLPIGRPCITIAIDVHSRCVLGYYLSMDEGTGETSRYEQFVEALTANSSFMYACPNVDTRYRLAELDISTPTFMRGPGEASGVFALECALDELAYALKLDPVELRRRNEPALDEGENRPFSSRSLLQCYETGAERFGWSRRNPAPRSMRDGRLMIGWGMATSTYPVLFNQANARVRMQPEHRIRPGRSATDRR